MVSLPKCVQKEVVVFTVKVAQKFTAMWLTFSLTFTYVFAGHRNIFPRDNIRCIYTDVFIRSNSNVARDTANCRAFLNHVRISILIFPFLRPDGKAEPATREQAALLDLLGVVMPFVLFCRYALKIQEPGLNLWG